MIRTLAVLAGGFLGFASALMVALDTPLAPPGVAGPYAREDASVGIALSDRFERKAELSFSDVDQVDRSLESVLIPVPKTKADVQLQRQATRSDRPTVRIVDRKAALYRLQFELARLDCFDGAVDGRWSLTFHERFAHVTLTQELDLAALGSVEAVLEELRGVEPGICASGPKFAQSEPEAFKVTVPGVLPPAAPRSAVIPRTTDTLDTVPSGPVLEAVGSGLGLDSLKAPYRQLDAFVDLGHRSQDVPPEEVPVPASQKRRRDQGASLLKGRHAEAFPLREVFPQRDPAKLTTSTAAEAGPAQALADEIIVASGEVLPTSGGGGGVERDSETAPVSTPVVVVPRPVPTVTLPDGGFAHGRQGKTGEAPIHQRLATLASPLNDGGVAVVVPGERETPRLSVDEPDTVVVPPTVDVVVDGAEEEAVDLETDVPLNDIADRDTPRVSVPVAEKPERATVQTPQSGDVDQQIARLAVETDDVLPVEDLQESERAEVQNSIPLPTLRSVSFVRVFGEDALARLKARTVRRRPSSSRRRSRRSTRRVASPRRVSPTRRRTPTAKKQPVAKPSAPSWKSNRAAIFRTRR